MAYTPLTSKVDGDTFTTPMWTNIKDNFDALYPGHIICTSSTRPTVGLAEGHMIWETDTNKLLVYDGSVWKDVFPVAAPTGTITQYAGAAAPTGYLLCDGSAVSRSTYADLFTILSTTYGSGDGSTTFNLPDLRGRVPVGKGTHADVDALGDNEGITSANVANRRPKHQHTVYDPSHAHSLFANAGQSGSGYGYVDGFANTSTGPINTDGKFTGVKVNPGGVASDTTSPQDSPAYLVLNHIIKT